VTNNQEAAAAAATLSDDQRRVLLKDLFGQVAGCFPRRETRQAASQMAAGLLMELEDYNCWSIAEAVGHRGPHRLQHLLARAAWDDRQVLDTAAARAAAQLDDGNAVLIVDETADEKSSAAGAVGAARQRRFRNTHVTPDPDKRDPPLSDQPPRETFRRTEQLGNLSHSQEPVHPACASPGITRPSLSPEDHRPEASPLAVGPLPVRFAIGGGRRRRAASARAWSM
jgi:hypothetical protein